MAVITISKYSFWIYGRFSVSFYSWREFLISKWFYLINPFHIEEFLKMGLILCVLVPDIICYGNWQFRNGTDKRISNTISNSSSWVVVKCSRIVFIGKVVRKFSRFRIIWAEMAYCWFYLLRYWPLRYLTKITYFLIYIKSNCLGDQVTLQI